MTLPKPDMVIFDMDGTTVRHLNPRILDIMERLDDMAYKFTHAFKFLPFRSNKKLAKKRRRLSPKLMVHRTFHTIRRRPVEQIVEPCPDIQDVLDFLKDRNIPICLVSYGLGRGYGHDILEQFDLKKYYEATLFAEDLNRSKPDPDPILKVLDCLQPVLSKTSVIWYIGDRHKDINAAINADKALDAKVVPLAYGYLGSACLAVLENNLGTDHIFGSYSEFLQTLRKIFNYSDLKKC